MDENHPGKFDRRSLIIGYISISGMMSWVFYLVNDVLEIDFCNNWRSIYSVKAYENIMTEAAGKKVHWRYSNEQVLDIFSRKIMDNMDKYYPEGDADGAIVTGKPWGGQETARTFRFEIRCANTTDHRVIFVKLCPVFPDLNPALLEYETLQILYHKMPLMQKDCYVSRPIDYYPDLHAYAMESVGTKSFKPYLLRNNSKLRSNDAVSELFSIISGCAAWLNAFHEITKSQKNKKFEYKTFVDNDNESFDHHLLKKYRFQNETIHQLDKLMETLVSLDNKHEVPCAKWHWDFTPGHVYLDNNRISVIDILGIDDTPIYEDIGRFLASMTAINNFPFYPFFDFRRSEGPLCDRFIESYAADVEFDPELFRLYANIYKLKYLIIWFFSQHDRVSKIINPTVGDAFANLRLVKLFERPILHTMEKITIGYKA